MVSICRAAAFHEKGVLTRSHSFKFEAEQPILAGFEGDLSLWVYRSPKREKEARLLAVELINECYHHDENELDLSELGLTDLPNLSFLISLKTLNVSGNELKEVPSSIGDLKDLKELDVSGNQIRFLPESLGGLDHLVTLNASGNLIGNFPESIVMLQSLVTLNMSDNELCVVPPLIAGLERLETLDVSSNLLNVFPGMNFTKLKDLDISNNEIDTFPEEVENLTFTVLGKDTQVTSLFDVLENFLTELEEVESVNDEWLELSDKLQHILSESEQKQYFDFTKFLMQAEDYTSSEESKRRLLIRFLSILHKATQDDDYKDRVSDIIRDEGLGSCRDGVTLAMDSLHTELLLHELPQGHTEQIIETLLGIQRMRLIKEVMMKNNYFVIDRDGKAIRFSDYREQKETILGLQQKLKKGLNLPLLSEEMCFDDYTGITSRLVANVKRSVIKQTSSIADKVNILMAYSQWRDHLSKDLEIKKIKKDWNNTLMKDPNVFPSNKPNKAPIGSEEANRNLTDVIDINASFKARLEKREREITEKFLERALRIRTKPDRFIYIKA